MNQTDQNVRANRPARVTAWDALRVFAAIMVILLHILTPYFTNRENHDHTLWWVTLYLNELARTGVPLFFMISGALLLSSPAARDTTSFYKKRFKKLLPALLIWSVVYYLSYRIPAGEPVLNFAFFDQFFQSGTAYHLWYLYAIALLYLFFPFLSRMLAGVNRREVLIFLLLVLLQPTLKPFLNTVLAGRLYVFLAEDGFVGYLGYAILGYYLSQYPPASKKKAVVCLLGLAVFLFCPLFSAERIQQSGDYYWNGGYTINHYCEAAALFLLFSTFFNKAKNGHATILSTLSSLTFSVYLVHVLVIRAVDVLFSAVRARLSPSIWMAIEFSTVTAISFAMAWLWSVMLRRWKNTCAEKRRR